MTILYLMVYSSHPATREHQVLSPFLEEVSMKRLLVLFVLVSAVLVSGCPKVAPNYPGGLATEPTNMRPFLDNKNGINMAIPAGWTALQVPAGDTTVKAQYKKDGTSALLQIHCQSFFANRYQLQINMLNLVNASTSANARLWPEYCMGGGFTDPEFSAWTGTASSGGEHNYYIAWKLDSHLGQCKYGLFLDVKKEDAAKVEGDFIAIVRTLK